MHCSSRTSERLIARHFSLLRQEREMFIMFATYLVDQFEERIPPDRVGEIRSVKGTGRGSPGSILEAAFIWRSPVFLRQIFWCLKYLSLLHHDTV